MTDTKYHQVLCSLTEQEYHQHFNLPDPDNRLHPPLLYQSANETHLPIFEDDIPLIVRDAILQTSPDDAAAEAIHDKDRDDFDPTPLPLPLKAAILLCAKEFWNPPEHYRNSYESSYWSGPQESAQKLLDDHPELLTMFSTTPLELAAAWQNRNTTQPTN